MLNSVRNTKGNILLQILAATAVMSTSFYFLTNYVIGQRQQVSKTSNVVNLRFALNSAMDYVIFGVRQKYCFSNDNLLMNDLGAECNLAHTGSVERLIMSTEQENFIRQLVSDGKNVGPMEAGALTQNKIRLKTIVRLLEVDKATTSHPLFPVLNSLKSVRNDKGEVVKVAAVRVTLTRNESINLPKAGREVYVDARADLVDSLGNVTPIKVGNKELTLRSQIVIYPREVGSFALLIPQDLYMDRAWDSTMNAGDVALHKFTSRKELAGSSGLVFQSPVFVNRNIYLPTDEAADDATPDSINYAGVTFADRVYMGNGDIMTAKGKYSPRNSGQMGDRFWADVRTFGGFLKGVENDGGLDAGLIYLADKNKSVNVDKTLMQMCQDMSQKQADVTSIYKSELGARMLDSGYNSADYRLYLSNWNYFSRQSNALTVDKTKWGNGKVVVDAADYNDAVVKLIMAVGDRTVEVQVPRSGTVTFTPEVGSAAFETSLRNKIKTSQATYDAAVKAETDLTKNLTAYRADLKDKQADLAEEMAKPVKPTSTESGTGTGTGTGTESGTKTVEKLETETKVEDSGTETAGTGTGTGSTGTGGTTIDYRDEKLVAELEKAISDLKKLISDLENNKIPAQSSVVNLASKQLDTDKTALNTYELQKANPPKIVVEVSRASKSYYFDKLDLDISATNVQNMIDKNGNYSEPFLGVLAYDSTYYKSNPIDPNNVNTKLMGYINMTFNSSKTQLNFPGAIFRTPSGGSAVQLAETNDLEQMMTECSKAYGTMTSAAFGGAGWDVSFAATARTSWNFAGDSGSTIKSDPALSAFEFDNMTINNATFQVRSIVGKCVIKASSTFVTGFMTCDELIIEKRSAPLRIIGTFIVGRMKIDPSAIKAGINWSSVYHPQATRELRAAGSPRILRSFSGADCNATNNEPIWHPIPSIKAVADRMNCNTISLRAKADPFQWTAVDPDCGIAAGTTASNTTCKRRLVRFFVVEQSREGGI
ncbi:hypothetical protein EP01_07335 [Bdellovibrio bacteriovorus]|uniref:hypothetical protein n=1 Tax=Bdellovibrio bacteriovorus TaxID=959 RepID=UPI00045C02F8|nr:hypothetical protein [Bdellovibrio bacteriovorus]AHZ84750.1 hypothetical protein EP01_07335 [Bdellovibrio bacteriovorus]